MDERESVGVEREWNERGREDWNENGKREKMKGKRGREKIRERSGGERENLENWGEVGRENVRGGEESAVREVERENVRGRERK